MKKFLSILALSSLMVAGSVEAQSSTAPSGGNVGPGGVEPVCKKRQNWCPVKNKCVAKKSFSSKCFPNGGLPSKIGPDGKMVCPLDGQFYCARDKSCLVLGSNYREIGALEVWCNTQPN